MEDRLLDRDRTQLTNNCVVITAHNICAKFNLKLLLL
jgi:hypothetical protein